MARRLLPLTLIAPGLVLGGCSEIQTAYLNLTSALSDVGAAAGPVTVGPQIASLAVVATPEPATPTTHPSAAAGPQLAASQAASSQGASAQETAPAQPAAAAKPAAVSRPHYVLGKPYQFSGVWYRPSVDYEYDESGIAALYDKDAQGQPTTDGEVYDARGLSAAHKTLPLPSMVRVTNEATGEAVELRVNDRGPFVDNRIIELSEAAAERLGIEAERPAKVRVQVMAEQSRALAAQAGAAGGISEEHLPAVPAPRVTTQPLAAPPAKPLLPNANAAQLPPVPADPMLRAAPALASLNASPARPSAATQLADADLSASPAALRDGTIHYVVGKPYQFDGVWYRPAVDYSYDEKGLAAVYGAGLSGQKTTDGEVYDDAILSAAHKTLPLPSDVRVTNLENGQSVELRINDRGPFADNRIIGLSRQAASLLGITNGSTAQVRVQVLAEESRKLAEALATGQGLPVGKTAPLPPGTDTAELPAVAPLPAPTALAAVPEPRHVTPGPQLASLTEVPLPEHTAMPLALYSHEQTPPTASVTFQPPLPRGAAIQAAIQQVATQPAPLLPAAVPAPSPVAVPPGVISTGASPSIALPGANRQVEAQPAVARRIYVQAGSFVDPANAERLRVRLADVGTVSIVIEQYGGKLFNCVRIGPLGQTGEAQQVLQQVAALGYKDAVLIGN